MAEGDNPQNQNGNGSGKGPKFPFEGNKFGLLILVGGVMMLLFLFSFLSQSGSPFQQRVSYTRFLDYAESGQLQRVEILDERQLRGTLLSGASGGVSMITARIPYLDMSLVERLRGYNVEVVGGTGSSSVSRSLLQLFPWVLMGLIAFSLFRGVNGGSRAFSFGKSRAQKYDKDKNRTTFQDVAGQIEAKYELQEVVEFLKEPKRFTEIGARIPRGVLLVGQPGTGKTLLARAVAGEAGVSFFHMSGSDFVEMFVGVGASRVRDLFEQGRKSAPCIVFIDEIDAVGRTRGAGYGGGHDEREQTLNQLLVEMDGFGSHDGLIVMAATNRPDVLDPALLRPGRFDRQVTVELPDLREREAILRLHSKKVKLGINVDFIALARRSAGTSGADLANMVNEAALFGARRKSATVEMGDFEEARDKVLMGVARKSRVMTENEKCLTAYHEAGHALVHYHVQDSPPLEKVTVIPRGMALGVTFSSRPEVYAPLQSFLTARIRICFGGFVAEELIYGQTTTGTSNDIKQATEIARRMVCEWGMSKEVGPVSFSSEGSIFIGRELSEHKDYAEETAAKIDREIRRIVSEALDDVRGILAGNRDQLKLLADTLIERETLYDDEIRKLLQLPLADSEKEGGRSAAAG